MTTESPETGLKKRKWVYAYPPKSYDMAPCSCGNTETMWSEFEKHLWCPKCEKDFIPEHAGVFDGPILLYTAYLLGIYFDRINLETNQYEEFDLEKKDWVPRPEQKVS